MPLFQFELFPVESIRPWDTPAGRSLSWFALTLGTFQVQLGDQVLFEYSPEICARWGMAESVVDYQVAQFVREVLVAAQAGCAPLPPSFEVLVRDGSSLDDQSWPVPGLDVAQAGLEHTALRWLGEREVFCTFLVAAPRIAFLRIADDVWIRWDARQGRIDGLPAWTATVGMFRVPVQVFKDQCRELAGGLLSHMAARVDALDSGAIQAQAPVDVGALRRQHDSWNREFEAYFEPHRPDYTWSEAEDAMREIAKLQGVIWPGARAGGSHP